MMKSISLSKSRFKKTTPASESTPAKPKRARCGETVAPPAEPEAPVPVAPPSPARVVVADPDPVPLSTSLILDTYAPKDVHALACNPPSAAEVVKDWIQCRLTGRPCSKVKKGTEGGKAMILCGPSGCGKRALVYAVASELRAVVEEPGGIDSILSLLRATEEGVSAHGLFVEPKVWLFTGVDGYLTSDDLSGNMTAASALKRLLSIWTSKRAALPPIILTMQGFPDNTTMRSLRQATTLPRVYFYPIKPFIAEKILTDIGTRERVPVQDIARVIRSFHGDLRHALLSLSMLKPSPVTCRRPATPVSIRFTPAWDCTSLTRALCLHLHVRGRNDSCVTFRRVGEHLSTDACTIRVIGFTEYDITKCAKRVQTDMSREFVERRREAMALYDSLRRQGVDALDAVVQALVGCVREDVDSAVDMLQQHKEHCTPEVTIQSDVGKWKATEPRVYNFVTVPQSEPVDFEIVRSSRMAAAERTETFKDVSYDTPFDAASALLDPRHTFTDSELDSIYETGSLVEKLLWLNAYADSMSLDAIVDIADLQRDMDVMRYHMDGVGSASTYLQAIRSARAAAKAHRPSFGSLKIPAAMNRAETRAAIHDIRFDSTEYAMLTSKEIADRMDVLRAHVQMGTAVDKDDAGSYTCTDSAAAFADGTYRALGVMPKHVKFFKSLGDAQTACADVDTDELVRQCSKLAQQLHCTHPFPDQACILKELTEHVHVLEALGVDVQQFTNIF